MLWGLQIMSVKGLAQAVGLWCPLSVWCYPSRHCSGEVISNFYTGLKEPSSRLSFSKGNWVCIFKYQPYTVRALRSVGLWTFGRREYLLFLRKNLEAGLPPPRTGGCPESLCKGNAEPWPWASLGDPGNGDCFKCPQRDGEWNLKTVISGQWCIIKMLVATLQYC